MAPNDSVRFSCDSTFTMFFLYTLSISYGLAVQTWVTAAQTHVSLILNHNSLGVPHVTLVAEFVSNQLQFCNHVRGQPKWFENDLIGHPLVMDTRPVNRLLDVHSMVNDINDHLGDGVDDRRAAWTADG